MKTPNPRISIAKHLAFVFCNSVMRPGAGCSLQDATGAIAVASSKDMLSSHLHTELEQPVPDLKHTSLLLEGASEHGTDAHAASSLQERDCEDMLRQEERETERVRDCRRVAAARLVTQS